MAFFLWALVRFSTQLQLWKQEAALCFINMDNFFNIRLKRVYDHDPEMTERDLMRLYM